MEVTEILPGDDVAVYPPLAPGTVEKFMVASVEEGEVTLVMVGGSIVVVMGLEMLEDKDEMLVPFVATTVNV
jgi:hypothetical protein